MQPIYRLSVDTLYVGLRIADCEVNRFLSEINNYLFFFDVKQINFHFSKNRFYTASYENSDFGFSMFLIPRKNCRNDTVTIQLTGKFFRRISMSKCFIDYLLRLKESFYYYDSNENNFVELDDYVRLVNFQRLDVALDVLYETSENVSLCEATNSLGFPLPSYSDDWRYQKIPFSTYGRFYGPYFFINMVSSGNNDVRIRVYDKVLDLHEKYKMSYAQYYSLKKEFELVYRIEIQLRSDKLKNLVDDFYLKGFACCDYYSLCDLGLNFMLKKFKFDNVDLVRVFDFSTYKKPVVPDMYKELENIRKNLYCFYKKYLKKADEIKFFEDMDKKYFISLKNYEIEKSNKLHEELYPKKVSEPFSTPFNLEFMDFEKEFSIQKRTRKTVPF